MAVLSSQQVYNYIRAAGATPEEARILTAIAKGESGWNTQAHNPVGRDNSYGLWQINMLGSMGAARRKQFGISSNEELWDPAVNAKAAVAILRSQGLKAWSVYTNGSYQQYLDGGGSESGMAAAPTGAAASGLPPNASPEQIEDYIRDNYPQAVGFLGIPELRKVLIDAAREQWTPEKLQGAMQATTWWRTNAAATREFIALKSTDPAEYEARIDRKIAELDPQMRQLGFKPFATRFLAESALKYGWTADEIRAHMAAYLTEQSGGAGLAQDSSVDVTADSIMAMARSEYLVPINRLDAERFAIDIFQGRKTEDQVRSYLGRIAASRFPGLDEQGFTPGEYMAPIRNIIAETLELNPADVNLLDRRWSQVLEAEGKDGKMRPMSLAEATKWARSTPEYQQTKGAQDEAAGMADFIGKTFGSVA